jgi:hypothetical protein
MPIFWTIIALCLIIAGLTFFFIKRKQSGKAPALKLFLVSLPQKTIFSSWLFNILTALKSPFSLEAAIHNIGEEIHFYAAIPEESTEYVASKIGNLSREIKLEPVEDYNIFNPQGISAGFYLKRSLIYSLPAGNFQEANFDKFAPILENLSKINEIGEGAVIQVLVNPVSHFPLFSVNLRVLASAPSQYQADAILENIIAGFSQFSGALRNEIKIVKPRNPQNLICQFSLREIDENQSMVLNKEELSTLFNLPENSTGLNS